MGRDRSRERSYDSRQNQYRQSHSRSRSYHQDGGDYGRDRNQDYQRHDRNRYQERQNFDSRDRPRSFERPQNFRPRENRPEFVDRNCPMPQGNPAPTTALMFEQGTSGRSIDVITNNFLISVQDNIIWQFHVTIDLHRDIEGKPGGKKSEPDSEATAEKEKEVNVRFEAFLKKFSFNVIKKFLDAKNLTDIPYAYDGSKTIFFQKDIGFALLEELIELVSNGRTLKFNVRIERVAHLSLGQISEYYRGQKECIPECLKQLFDIVFRDVAAEHYELFQGNNYDLSTASSKPGMDDVQFVNGFRRCVRQTLSGFVLNVHLKTCCVVSSRYTSLESLYLAKCRPGMDDLASINSIVRHLEVSCTHGRPRAYKVDKLISQKPSEIFLDNQTSMIDYFKEKYNIDINPEYPVVKVLMRKDTFLPLELCSLTIQQFLAHNKISPTVQREVLMRSTNAPNVYFNKLDKFVKRISSNSEKLKSFGLALESKPMALSARVLEAPRNNGSGRSDPFVKPTNLKHFSLFCLEELNSRLLDSFCQNLESSSRRFGLRISCHTKRILTIRNPEDVAVMCKNIYDRLKDQVIIIAIPRSNSGITPGQIYNFVKYLSERKYHFITQCIRSDVIQNLPRGYMDNFLMKVNGKYGGINQQLAGNAFENLGFNSSKTMIVAYDVNHPSFAETSNQSIVAVVGSYDQSFGRFHSSISKQAAAKEEMVSDLDDHIEKLLRNFHKHNGFFPENIIIYRDGITEQQFELCHRLEIASIERGVKRVGLKIKLVFLVAQKKHGVRFALTKPDNSGRNPSYNLPAGSVVDTAVISAKCPNFFLTSHFSPLGTARNVHFYILRNDIKMTMDQIENFTYRSCYNNVRSRQISFIPLALRYVDLLAYRGKLYSEADFLKENIKCHDVSEAIADNLFYC